MLLKCVTDHKAVSKERPLVLESVPDVSNEWIERLTRLWERYVVNWLLLINVNSIPICAFYQELLDAF